MARTEKPVEVGSANALLHDEKFSMAEINFNRETGVVEIPFDTDPPRVLLIRQVVAVTSEDPDGLIEHSYARLISMGPEELRLLSNFPGHVDFVVSAIDVSVDG